MLIVTDILNPQEAYDDYVVDQDGAGFYIADKHGSVSVGASTNIYKAKTKQFEDVQQ